MGVLGFLYNKMKREREDEDAEERKRERERWVSLETK